MTVAWSAHAALPEFVRRIEEPRGLRKIVAASYLHAVDAGWTRRLPLETHLVVCGFPRAGTTLLSLMLQVAFSGARAFRKERPAVRIAYFTDRNHRLLISKRPDDVFYIDRVREIYAGRRPRARFVLNMRDPRAVLTSVHAAREGGYYVSPARWRATYDRLNANRGKPDCLMVRFEDLVTGVEDVQAAITSFIGVVPDIPFADFVSHVPADFRATALNGIRALDPGAASKWRDPKHANRLKAMLRELPELPQVLIDTGYERDTAWTRIYLFRASTIPAVPPTG